MASEQTGQQGSTVIQGRPTSSEIMSRFKDADNIMDFIKANSVPTPKPEPAPATPDFNVKEEIKRVEDTRAAVDSTKDVEQVVDFVPPVPGDDNAAPAKDAVEPAPVEGEEPADGVDVPNVPASENFKRLRTKLKETTRTLKDLTEEREKLARELEEYKSGAVVPEVLQEKENRIAELERYETLHSLKTSREYRESFVAPLTTITNKLQTIAADYELPVEVMNQAMTLTNRADLNRFLSEHFDDVGAVEVKQLITEAQGIQAAAKEAENEPARAMERLVEEHKRTEEVRNGQRKAKIASVSKSAWVDSLLHIKEENKASELIMKEGDEEHNTKYVRPLLTAAATEYGKIISQLAELGVEDLPKELSYALARMVQLAHASAVSLSTRDAAVRTAQELEANTKRTANMVRPPLGGFSGGVGGGGAAAPKAPMSSSEAAGKILEAVLSRTR